MKKNLFLVMMVSLAIFTGCNSCDNTKEYYFSVSDTQTVTLATSNLVYSEAEGLAFAPNAYDCGGVFAWGTGSNPALADTAAASYAEFADWGAQLSGSWRTLTSKEWRYMVMSRENASAKFGYATVNGVQGLVLLPDNYDSAAFVKMFHSGMGDYTLNSYDAEGWAAMEQHGAIFLPVTGVEQNGDGDAASKQVAGCYWTSTEEGETSAYYYNFSATYMGASLAPRSNQYSVRLAQDYQTKESKKDDGQDASAPQIEEFEDGAIIVM